MVVGAVAVAEMAVGIDISRIKCTVLILVIVIEC